MRPLRRDAAGKRQDRRASPPGGLARPATASAPAGDDGVLRIVLTGGPGGGKTTAADLFRRELGERVVVVPESATILFGGGFPRVGDRHAIEPTQRAVYAVQRNLEDVHAALYPERVQLCDRGTVDGAAYWPAGGDDFFASMGTTHAGELARYDAVIFLETAAVGGIAIEGGNRYRTESNAAAIELDRRLRALWAPHPRVHVVAHEASFLRKVTTGLAILDALLPGRDRAEGPWSPAGSGGRLGGAGPNEEEPWVS
jgi:cytidylate kinase